METNEKVQTEQGSGFESINKMFQGYYEKPAEKKTKLTKEEILAKYFTPRNNVEQFRILPPLQGREIIEKAYFHYVKVNDPKSQYKGKSFRKIYCPAHNSPKIAKLDAQGNVIKDQNGKPVMIAQRCPLCEKKNALLSKQDNSSLKDSEGKFLKKEQMNEAQLKIKEKNDQIYKDAMQFDAKKYHIVRGIDRGKVKDGAKYWRFKDNFKNQGVLDKLVPALKLFYDEYNTNPTDINNGTDLYINVVDSEIPGTGKKYKDVSSITARKPSKLYDDPIVVKQWLEDKSTWRDIFKPATMTRVLTSEEYLDRIAEGTDPYYDETSKRYVFPSPADAALQAKANEKTQSLAADPADRVIDQASDLETGAFDTVNISNVTKKDVGTFQDNHMDLGAKFNSQPPQSNVQNQTEEADDVDGVVDDDDDYGNLPF